MLTASWHVSSSVPERKASGVEEHVHDCIVVGAGPAGAAAALQMARDGLDVVLVERGRVPGEKNVMSGVLIPYTLAKLIPEYRELAPLERCITGGYELYLLGDDEVLRLPSLRDFARGDRVDPPFTVFRAKFDAWFAAEAEKAGAELFTETLVEDLLWTDGQVVGVSTKRGDLLARVVLGADGINSTVAEKAGLGRDPEPDSVSLIVREVLDLAPERIEERFNLRPGEGVLSLFYGTAAGAQQEGGSYYSELYTNQDSLSFTVEIQLDTLQAAGVPVYDVMAERECHPYISRLMEGTRLREYQAHLIPYGGVGDSTKLYGNGVLLAGDAGWFTTVQGVGSWPAMASGVAAARAVKRACDLGDTSKAGLAAYLDHLDDEGLLESQREARKDWLKRGRSPGFLSRNPEGLVRLAQRYYESWLPAQPDYDWSFLKDAYQEMIRPADPWYLRWPLGMAAWVDDFSWQRKKARERKAGGG
jgi:electron transfer flavoprotein-quinone oxidoreductase